MAPRAHSDSAVVSFSVNSVNLDAGTHSVLYPLTDAYRDPGIAEVSRNGNSGFRQALANTCSVSHAQSSSYP